MTRLSAFEESPNKSKENWNIKQNEKTSGKRTRVFEVLSIACCSVGVNIVIACFYGAPNVFGIRSPEALFNCAFAFLVASVILGVLGMISVSRNGSSQTSPLWTSKFSKLYRRFNRALFTSKNKLIENVSSTQNSKFEEHQFEEVKTSQANKIVQAIPKFPSDLPGVSRGDQEVNLSRGFKEINCPSEEVGFPGEKFGENIATWKNGEFESKALLRLNKKPAFLFGQCTISQGSSLYTKSSNFILYDPVGNCGRTGLIGRLQESLMSEVYPTKIPFQTQMKTKEPFSQRPETGISRCRLYNLESEGGPNYNFHGFAPSTRVFQKSPRKDQVSEVVSKLNEMNILC